MSTYRAASPYGGLSFDFESYEAEVEKGKQRVIIALIMNMILVLVNIVVNQLMLAQQTTLIVKLMQTPAMMANLSDAEQTIKQMQAVFESPTYSLYMLLSQLVVYLIIAVLPWVAIYLGKHSAKGLVGMVASLQGIAGVLLSPVLLWYGLYGFALFALSFGAIKLYTAGILLVVPSVKKYFNHCNL